MYNEAAIAAFWRRRPGELAARWAKFAGISAPWLTRLATAFLRGSIERDQVALARDAVSNLARLGPTWVKLGQVQSALAALRLLEHLRRSCSSPASLAVARPVHAFSLSFSLRAISTGSLACMGCASCGCRV